MKVAIPSSSDKIEALIDDRFARCSFFCFYDTITRDFEFVRNNLNNAMGGVGPQVVEFLANNGINEVYAVEVGPKAQMMLDKLNIPAKLADTGQTVQQIIEKLNN